MPRKQCFQKFLDLNAGDSLGRQRALRYIHDPELVRARSGAAFRRYHARRPEHLSRADGVLEDEHIGDASIEGKLKKLVSRAKDFEAATPATH